jgi:uncharacterized membrane protein
LAAPPDRPAPPAPARDRVALSLVGLAAAVYGGLNHYRLAHFYPLEWDLAIFEQGLSRLSRLETPFVSVRGLHLFGDHATFVHLLLAPLDALVGPVLGPHLLLLVQTLALAASGVLLFDHARARLPRPAARLVLAAYLVYPPLQFTWLEYYEPVNLAVPCLVGAYAAIREGRDRAALLWCALALVTMENLALTVAALGVFALGRGRRRLGGGLVAGAGLYVALLMAVVFPWLNPGGYVYGHRLYGDYAAGLPGAVAHLARPDRLVARLATVPNALYLAGLLVPAGLLPLLAPGVLLLAVQLPLNMVSSWPYAREIRYHYVAPIVPFVFLAVIEALAARRERRGGRTPGLVLLAAGAVCGQALFAPPWLASRAPWRGLAEDASERRAATDLLARLPEEASVSAHYRFLPHLARRRQLFMFPDLGPGGRPDAVVVDLGDVEAHESDREAFRRVAPSCPESARTPGGTVLLQCPGDAGAPMGQAPPPARPPASGRNPAGLPFGRPPASE